MWKIGHVFHERDPERYPTAKSGYLAAKENAFTLFGPDDDSGDED